MATKATKPVARPKRTKAEIEEEFSDIREEVAATRETTDKKQRKPQSYAKRKSVKRLKGFLWRML